MAFTPKVMYKGKPLVRCNREVYYGNLTDPYMIAMQILNTKEENGLKMADKIHVMLMSTDNSKPPQERILRQSNKVGFYNALSIGEIWLEKALSAPADK